MKHRIGGELVKRLYTAGFIKERDLYSCSRITVADMCNRRLPVVMKRMRMVSNIKDATTFVQHGHVKFGTRVVRDPSVIVSRGMEDCISWVESSKIKKKIEEFNEERDDFRCI